MNNNLFQLGDLITIKHGFAFKGEYFSEKPTHYQLVTPGNFAIGGGFQLGKGKFYSGPIPEDYILQTNDLIVTMTDLSKQADTLGFAAKVPKTEGTTWLHNQRIGLVQVKKDSKLLPEYLYYLMRSNRYRQNIVASATGSTVKHTSPDRIYAYKFNLPSMDEQNRIASILASLDERIILLREANFTLEAIAQTLFKSWFIDFDPVHAKAERREPEGMDAETAALFPDSFEESELGFIPKGWRVGILDDIAKTVGGQKQTKDFNSDVNYVGLEHMPRNSLGLFEWSTAEGLASAKSCFALGDILFGKLRPYFHKVVIAPFDGVCSTDILVCQSKKISFYGIVLMHLFSNSLINYASRLSNGAKMPRINWKDLAKYPIILPPEQVAESFSISIQPLLDRMKENTQQAKVLASLRDILLPRLISGQLCLSREEAKVTQ